MPVLTGVFGAYTALEQPPRAARATTIKRILPKRDTI
jgi:hypothetical protein